MSPTQLRNAVARLTDRATLDLAALWRQVDTAVKAEQALHDILPALVDRYGSMAAALAAAWYDDLRAKQGISGRFEAVPASIPDSGEHALVGWALSSASDFESFQSLIIGGTQRRIADFSRHTVMGSSVADPQAKGWQRVSSGGCAFCDMLAGRGSVYSEATADFASHDHCQCSAVPAFDGQAKPVKAYTPSSRKSTDADRARVRDWIASH